MVANMVAEMVAHMVADMVTDMVADMVTDMVADMEVYNKLDQIELDLGPRHEYVHHVYEWERLRGA